MSSCSSDTMRIVNERVKYPIKKCCSCDTFKIVSEEAISLMVDCWISFGPEVSENHSIGIWL